MRKINKDYSDIPISLIPAYSDFFENGVIDENANDTHTKRLEIINNGAYIDEERYNSRYRYSDVKAKLSSIYHNKCAFCEQRIEQYHVEHYRPKKGGGSYYWLAFSWDNLLLACPKCNSSKGTHFKITGSKAIFVNTENNIKNINTLSSTYDQTEQPKMINPEIVDPESLIRFDRSGSIYSNDDRFKYTIEKRKLDRTYLKDERKKIFDEFEKKLKYQKLKYAHDPMLLKSHLSELISEYNSDANDLDKEYLAYRKYSIKDGWLHTSLRKIVGNKIAV